MIEHLAWPTVAVVLGITAMFLFRPQISRLIDRTTKIDKSGLATAPQQAAVEEKQSDLLDSKELMEVGVNEIVKHHEKTIVDQLGKVRFRDAQEKEALLIRALAHAQLRTVFDRISNVIFGSQLELLIKANGNPAGLSEGDLKARFDTAKASAPAFHAGTTYESFKAFLINSNLLMLDNGVLRIATFGKEFMKFLIDTGNTFPRPG